MRERRNLLETMLLLTNQSSDSVGGDLFVAVVKYEIRRSHSTAVCSAVGKSQTSVASLSFSCLLLRGRRGEEEGDGKFGEIVN